MSARFDGLDRVRAGSMLLGVVYHSTWAFMPDIGRWFPVQATSTWSGFVVLAALIHAARMPVFFALSGFFAALVLEKRGDGFLVDRFKRLMVPFLVAVPITLWSDVLLRRASLAQGTMAPTFEGQGDWLWRPLHLWFLEYLFLFCVLAWAWSKARRSVRVEALLRVPEVLLLASGLTAGTVFIWGEPQPAFSFVPQIGAVAYFAPFFAFGWALYASREAAAALQRRGWWMIVAGVALAGVVFTRPLQWQPLGQELAALVAWLLVLGLVGVSSTSGTRPAGTLVHAAYWVYLVHHPLVQWGQVLVAKATWPAFLSYLTVVVGVFAVSFASFFVVQRTPLAPWVGAPRR